MKAITWNLSGCGTCQACLMLSAASLSAFEVQMFLKELFIHDELILWKSAWPIGATFLPTNC